MNRNFLGEAGAFLLIGPNFNREDQRLRRKQIGTPTQ
jgi:hypothetical protein